ncbi:MAG: hypothetical protein CL582_10320 [Alteromonadaceae bacterium]|nr:hypothetical protein [Alteromonadaceae bacterium]|tara:strand:+ start:624 stop:1097 length:474 start_codon:yes stop_codon:yes gene_type:complete
MINFDEAVDCLHPNNVRLSNERKDKLLADLGEKLYIQQHRTITIGSARQSGHTTWALSKVVMSENTALIVETESNYKHIQDMLEEQSLLPHYLDRVFTSKDVINSNLSGELDSGEQLPQFDVIIIDTCNDSHNANAYREWISKHCNPRDVAVVQIIN